jgi:hypothetical protein
VIGPLVSSFIGDTIAELLNTLGYVLLTLGLGAWSAGLL